MTTTAVPGEVFDLYRYDRHDGTGKLWAVRANGDGTITTRWGPNTGRDGVRVLPQEGTRRGNKESLRRAKERKGYRFEAAVVIRGDGVIGSQAVEHGPPATVVNVIYYELRPAWAARGKEAVLGEVRRLASAIGNELRALGVPDVQVIGHRDPGPLTEGVVHIGHWTNRSWFQGEPVTRVEGQVKARHRPWVLLFLMALGRRLADRGLGTLSLVDESGVELGTDPLRLRPLLDFEDGTFLGASDAVAHQGLTDFRKVAEALGLTSPSLDLSEVEVPGGSFYF